jgi:hypothetical protein
MIMIRQTVMVNPLLLATQQRQLDSSTRHTQQSSTEDMKKELFANMEGITQIYIAQD